ncbi:MAG: adenosylcobinamide-GDP ribazoletransferase [Acidimicrobiales bacterium]
MRRALAFLTPVGGAAVPGAGTLSWFPLAGAGIGAALGVGWVLAGLVWPPALAAALVVIADLALTGMLHFDGLVDSADGLLPHLARERRLEVMAEPAAGAFGVGVGAGVLLVRWAALVALVPSVLLLAGLWCASRTAMAAAARFVPYARPGGLASTFVERKPGRGVLAPMVGGVALAAILAGVASGVVGLVSLVAALAGSAGIVGLGRRRLGGFTGDVLGAAGMVGETIGLVVAAARW